MRVAVYGSGGHGKVVADIVVLQGEHDFVGYLDDDPGAASQSLSGHPVGLAGDHLKDIVHEWELKGVALGIGDNIARHGAAKRCQDLGLALVQAIHPAATIAPTAEIGEGVAIMAGTVVNPFAILEEGVTVNTAASVDHDCRIRRYAHLWPGARLAGNVEVGEFTYVGMGASVLQNLRLGSHVTVGAGAVVLQDLEDGVTAVGVPARPLGSKSSKEVG